MSFFRVALPVLVLAFGHHTSSAQEILIPYRNGDHWGICNLKKEILLPPHYDSIHFNAHRFPSGFHKTFDGENTGIASTHQEIVPARYTECRYLDPFIIKATHDRAVSYTRYWDVYLMNGSRPLDDQVREIIPVKGVGTPMYRVTMRDKRQRLVRLNPDRYEFSQTFFTDANELSVRVSDDGVVRIECLMYPGTRSSYELIYDKQVDSCVLRTVKSTNSKGPVGLAVDEFFIDAGYAEAMDTYSIRGERNSPKDPGNQVPNQMLIDRHYFVVYKGKYRNSVQHLDVKNTQFFDLNAALTERNYSLGEWQKFKWGQARVVDYALIRNARNLRGMLYAEAGEPRWHYQSNYILFEKRKKLGIMTQDTIIPPQFDSVYGVVGDGVVHQAFTVGSRSTTGGLKFGMIDSKGKQLLPIQYDSIKLSRKPSPLDGMIAYNGQGSGLLMDGVTFKVEQADEYFTIPRYPNYWFYRVGEKYGYYVDDTNHMDPTFPYPPIGKKVFRNYSVQATLYELVDRDGKKLGYASKDGTLYFDN